MKSLQEWFLYDRFLRSDVINWSMLWCDVQISHLFCCPSVWLFLNKGDVRDWVASWIFIAQTPVGAYLKISSFLAPCITCWVCELYWWLSPPELGSVYSVLFPGERPCALRGKDMLDCSSDAELGAKYLEPSSPAESHSFGWSVHFFFLLLLPAENSEVVTFQVMNINYWTLRIISMKRAGSNFGVVC